jgi:ubiquinone/menaquinone biosynthesis C-methylase UbiE
MSETQGVDSKLYDKEYFESTHGAHYFAEGKTAPKFIYAANISGLSNGDSALDIGCGRGDLMIALAQHGANVTGIDYSKDALGIAQKAIDKQPANLKHKLKVTHSNATALNFSDKIFDYVFMTDIVEHLYPPELQKCFEECHRVLKPEGKLIVHTAPNKWYNDFGYPLWEQPINKIINRLFRQNLLTRPIRTELDHNVHVNEQTILSLKKYLIKTGFNSKIWLGAEYVVPGEKNSTGMQLLEIFRQIVCHAYPLSLFPPFSYLFCNDIWAIAQKG